jgi:hypothetical protein
VFRGRVGDFEGDVEDECLGAGVAEGGLVGEVGPAAGPVEGHFDFATLTLQLPVEDLADGQPHFAAHLLFYQNIAAQTTQCHSHSG